MENSNLILNKTCIAAKILLINDEILKWTNHELSLLLHV